MMTALSKAPSYVLDLVKVADVQDHFRFGNGGVPVSRKRVGLRV